MRGLLIRTANKEYQSNENAVRLRPLLEEALVYSVLSGISMFKIFGTDIAAPLVLRIIATLHTNQDLRVEDLSSLAEVDETRITRHLQRLQKIGFVDFQKYKEGVRFSWNHEKSTDQLRTEVQKARGRQKSNDRIKRIITIGEYLAKQAAEEERPLSPWEVGISLRYSALNHTQQTLRTLQELGFVIPTNDYRGENDFLK